MICSLFNFVHSLLSLVATGGFGHLSYGAPKQVWPIWPFVWKA